MIWPSMLGALQTGVLQRASDSFRSCCDTGMCVLSLTVMCSISLHSDAPSAAPADLPETAQHEPGQPGTEPAVVPEVSQAEELEHRKRERQRKNQSAPDACMRLCHQGMLRRPAAG